MINSMTGYGCADGQFKSITYVIEIKTVNNRYFKSKLKLPDSLAFLEDDIDKMLRQELSRGMANLSLKLKNVSADVLFSIDEKGLKTYIKRFSELAKETGIQSNINIADLLVLPGIMTPIIPDEEEALELKEFVQSITKKALDNLKKMRNAEGQALNADLQKNIEVIKQCVNQISLRKDEVPLEYQKRLRSRVDSLLASAEVNLDESTLSKEIALFAERSDIAEEIARLDSHMQQFEESCKSEEQAGRKLDFITQEMLREANTIASKSCDVEISKNVVEIKCRIDRLKEQVQNVE